MKYAIPVAFEIEAKTVFEAISIVRQLTKPCTLDYRCSVDDIIRPSDCVALDDED
jgi:hypothetical protein